MEQHSAHTPSLLIASDYYHPHWTGIVKAMVNLTSVLRGRTRISVVTVRYGAELPREETVDEVRILREEPLFRVSRASYSVMAIAKFFREVQRHDTVLINSPCTNVLPYAIVAKLFGRRLAIFHQGDLKLRAGWHNRVIEAIFQFCTIVAMSLADVVSTYTLDYAEQSSLLRRFLHKFRPMRMPMLVREPPAQLPPGVLPMSELHFQGKVIFGIAGRFVHEKGFDVLFKAIPAVLERLPNAHFVFAGETNVAYENFYGETQALLERVRSAVTFLGLLPERDLWAFYHKLDFVVISSRSDCFPLVQMEACLCGKPAVCTDIPGARYLVKHTGFGLICKAEDPADLAAAIVAIAGKRSELMPQWQKVKDYLDVKSIADENFSILFPDK